MGRCRSITTVRIRWGACARSTATSECLCGPLAYIQANGPDGLRQTTEDAVLNANYIRKGLEGTYDLLIPRRRCTKVVFSDRLQAKKGVRTMDIAKRLIDYGFHPYTTAFPLIVPGALMIERPRASRRKRWICSSRP